jgi:hypothetical protein
MISKSLKQVYKHHALLANVQTRAMGGGPKKPNMPASETNYDVVFIGGMNAAAITKFV